MLVSKDGAETFTDVTGNLPDTFAGDVIVAGDRLIAATDHGVFTTTVSSPGQWVPFGTAQPAVPGYKLQLNPQGSKLVLATYGRGVWTLKLKGLAPPGGAGAPGAAPRPPSGSLPATGLPTWVLLAPLLVVAGLVRRRFASRG